MKTSFIKDTIQKTKKFIVDKRKQRMRIAVLEDTIALINAGRLKLNTGSVVNTDAFDYAEEDSQLRPLLNKHFEDGGSCYVCQRGALLLSVVSKYNDFRVCDIEMSGTSSDVILENKTDKRLLEIFDKEQLAMMETAFEGRYNERLLSHDIYQKCIEFRYNLPDEIRLNHSNRSIAILKNAIANKGIFKP